jgi:hypothetical protein
MRSRLIFVLLLLTGLNVLAAEPETAPQPLSIAPQPLSIYVLRTGESLQGPHVTTYRLFEYAQQRGRWILPDVGYYDTGRLSEQLWLAGGGAELARGRHALWTEELYAVQEAGSATHNQRSLMVWTQFDFHFKPRLTGQVIVYPTVPLDRSARWGFDTDRAKLEFKLHRKLLIGPGYNSTACGGGSWQNRPFLTTTLLSRSGNYEFWVERTPGGAQIQVRYQLVRKGF